ncbi:hypothetical protein [Emticicia sp. BO119]|uniref:hypothetical protein n=1 Tax=Emticicia sp. BO119 TaxID=2757768 RepID=UPI0015EFEB09|nr:hypothetical protein [Emticicia sp. BO119]MBA4852271.1 hypothetical protein [Emticicia sp. BO119]
MKNQRLPLLISAFNLLLILFIAAKPSQENFDKIRVKEFELVDKAGIKRASLKTENDGSVIMRMIDKTGTIRIKLGADENGSGLVMLNNSTEVGFHAVAKKEKTTLVLADKDGKKREY